MAGKFVRRRSMPAEVSATLRATQWLLGWSLRELAAPTGLDKSTIGDFASGCFCLSEASETGVFEVLLTGSPCRHDLGALHAATVLVVRNLTLRSLGYVSSA